MSSKNAASLARPIENVWNYPRPPLLERTPARLRVVWEGKDGGGPLTVADTTAGYRVLETSHPPTYYFPPSSVNMELLRQSKARQTYCEWKGMATYHDLVSKNESVLAKGRIWSYEDPTPGFKDIKGYLCFYATSKSQEGAWRCYVDDDEAKAQEGDFYGSWVTPEITGGEKGFKGGPGTMGW